MTIHTDPAAACREAEQARRAGDAQRAARLYRDALAASSRHPAALAGLGRLALDQRDWQGAEAHYEQFLQVQPGDTLGHYGLATARLEMGAAEEAEAAFDRLILRGDTRAQIYFMRGRARLQCRRVAEAIDDLRRAWAGDPSPLTLQALAGTLWMAGDDADFDRTLREAVRRPALLDTAADLLRQKGAPAAAISLIEQAAQHGAVTVPAVAVVATAYVDLNEAAAAERMAFQCLQHAPGHEVAMAALLSAFLMQRRPDKALEAVAPSRRAQPAKQHWIAYEATALRMLGDAKYNHWVDVDRFVCPFELPVPEGYGSLEEFNGDLLSALDRWQVFEREPLGQTLRGGTQVPRELLGLPEAPVQAFLRAIDAPIREYLAKLGCGTESPVTERNTNEYRLSGAWSVKLRGGGFHVDHVHPSGWISSAYYASVPQRRPQDDPLAGQIHFGRPPFECGLDAEKRVEPRAGMLVLFPSYLWHGTSPTGPDVTRVTTPFDLVPGPSS